MASNIDFVVKNGLQVSSNLVVGTYTLNAAPVANGAIISGRVGIGTSRPGSLLHVAGNTTVSNVLTNGFTFYPSGNLDLSARDANPDGIFISNDGSNFYVTGGTSRAIMQFGLSTPWDLGSAAFQFQSPSMATQTLGASGLYFRPDGLKVWVASDNLTSGVLGVFEYNLSIPWHVGTQSFVYSGNSLSVYSTATTPTGIYWKPDGTALWIVNSAATGTAPRSVIEYTPASPWTIGGMVSNVATRTFSVAGQETAPQGLSFSQDGSRMFISGSTGDDLTIYNLSTPWDITTSTYFTEHSYPSRVSNITTPMDHYIRPDGGGIYVLNDVGTGLGAVVTYQFNADPTEIDLVGSTRVAGDLTVDQSLTVSGKISGYKAGFTSNVGVGTAVASSMLHVYGNVRINNSVLDTSAGLIFPDGTIQRTAQVTVTNVAAFSASNVTVTQVAGGAAQYLTFAPALSGNIGLRVASGLTYTPTDNSLSLTSIGGTTDWLANPVKPNYGGTGLGPGEAVAGGLFYITTDPQKMTVLDPNSAGIGPGNVLILNGSRYPDWGKINVGSAASVTGVLSVTNGGTSSAITPTLGAMVYSTASNLWLTSTSAFVWDNTNARLGLGIATPSQTLDVNGAVYLRSNARIASATATTNTTTGALVVTGGIGLGGAVFAGGSVTGTAFIPTSSTVPSDGMYLPATNTLGWSTSGVEEMRLNSLGNLGIGVTNPLAIFHSGNNVTDTSTYSFAETGALISSRFAGQRSARTNTLTLARDGTSGVVFAGIAAFDMSGWASDGTTPRTQLDLRLANTTAIDLVDVISFRSSGFVGINNTVPTQVIDVNGPGLFRANLTIGSANATTTTTTGALVVAGGIGLGGAVFAGGSATAASFIPTSSTIPSNGLFLPAANQLGLATSGGEKIRVDTNGNVAIGATSTVFKLEVNGSFAATTKSFVIDHPTKSGQRLRYASLEGPENGVYFRGRVSGDLITLPDYWLGLVHDQSITVDLTPIGFYQRLYVIEANSRMIKIGNDSGDPKTINAYYTVFAERKDVPHLEVEIQ